MTGVNLDSMIRREDFNFADEEVKNSGSRIDKLGLTDLCDNAFLFNALRKPDFQRETNEWNPQKVCDLVSSFITGNLIPAVIFWNKNNSNTFVIDGSHRLSALAAWVNDDYGDGDRSKNFYDDKILPEQIKIADKTRAIIKNEIGTYNEHIFAIKSPQKVRLEIANRAKTIAFYSLNIQWVTGNEYNAEESFFKINQSSEPINKTELILLKNRRSPSVLASRAIMNGGKGHKYWDKFDNEKQKYIVDVANKLFNALFRPSQSLPIKSIEKISMGGRIGLANTLPLIWNFVNIVNNFNTYSKDETGTETIKHLTACKKITDTINSNDPASLGLHPVVYFYSSDGRHKPASFYATIEFMKKLNTNDEKNLFINVREQFEDILIRYDYLVQQIGKKIRGADKSYTLIADFYYSIILKLNKNKNIETVMNEIVKSEPFQFLILRQENNNEGKYTNDEFSNNTKSKIFIQNALTSALKCHICNGYIHNASTTFDHVERKQDGGMNSPNNGQLAHPYCNTTYKN